MKARYLAMLFMAVTAGAQESPFSAWWLSSEIGITQGLGEIKSFLEPAPLVRVGVETAYAPQWRALVGMSYSYINGWHIAERSDLGEIPLHDFRGQVGLVRRLWRGSQIGAGINIFLTRTAISSDSPAHQYLAQKGHYIQDNESEFGWHIRWSSPKWQIRQWTFACHAVLEEAWTLPQRTHFISSNLGVKYPWF
ncbi:MAG: hypothetical protein GX801_10485 [Fibrobacter sp.]|nr:hypothetical protein [Fibrobacter sp.]